MHPAPTNIRSRHTISIAGRVNIFHRVSEMHRIRIKEGVGSCGVDFLEKKKLIDDLGALLRPQSILSRDEVSLEHSLGLDLMESLVV